MEIVISESYSAVHNLALEEYLLINKINDDPLLYLWQNDRAVIIGRNQNIYMECNLEYAQKNNIVTVRRLSGGGAVYHDLGGLNYTVFYKNNSIYKDTIFDYILKILRGQGLHAQRSGRNDIEVDGRKVSGAAYYIGEINSFQHGCLLINSDLKKMDYVLKIYNSKIKSKNIPSIKARVMNIAEEIPGMNISLIKKAFIEKAALLSNNTSLHEKCLIKKINPEEMRDDKIDKLIKKYSSVEWNFDKHMNMSYEVHDRFHWGDCTMIIESDDSAIKDVKIFSDALDVDIFNDISSVLTGTVLRKILIKKRIETLNKNYTGSKEKQEILEDIKDLVDRELDVHE